MNKEIIYRCKNFKVAVKESSVRVQTASRNITTAMGRRTGLRIRTNECSMTTEGGRVSRRRAAAVCSRLYRQTAVTGTLTWISVLATEDTRVHRPTVVSSDAANNNSDQSETISSQVNASSVVDDQTVVASTVSTRNHRPKRRRHKVLCSDELKQRPRRSAPWQLLWSTANETSKLRRGRAYKRWTHLDEIVAAKETITRFRNTCVDTGPVGNDYVGSDITTRSLSPTPRRDSRDTPSSAVTDPYRDSASSLRFPSVSRSLPPHCPFLRLPGTVPHTTDHPTVTAINEIAVKSEARAIMPNMEHNEHRYCTPDTSQAPEDTLDEDCRVDSTVRATTSDQEFVAGSSKAQNTYDSRSVPDLETRDAESQTTTFNDGSEERPGSPSDSLRCYESMPSESMDVELDRRTAQPSRQVPATRPWHVCSGLMCDCRYTASDLFVPGQDNAQANKQNGRVGQDTVIRSGDNLKRKNDETVSAFRSAPDTRQRTSNDVGDNGANSSGYIAASVVNESQQNGYVAAVVDRYMRSIDLLSNTANGLNTSVYADSFTDTDDDVSFATTLDVQCPQRTSSRNEVRDRLVEPEAEHVELQDIVPTYGTLPKFDNAFAGRTGVANAFTSHYSRGFQECAAYNETEQQRRNVNNLPIAFSRQRFIQPDERFGFQPNVSSSVESSGIQQASATATHSTIHVPQPSLPVPQQHAPFLNSNNATAVTHAAAGQPSYSWQSHGLPQPQTGHVPEFSPAFRLQEHRQYLPEYGLPMSASDNRCNRSDDVSSFHAVTAKSSDALPAYEQRNQNFGLLPFSPFHAPAAASDPPVGSIDHAVLRGVENAATRLMNELLTVVRGRMLRTDRPRSESEAEYENYLVERLVTLRTALGLLTAGRFS